MNEYQKNTLAKCKYYKGGEDCPYDIKKDHAKFMFWNGEASAFSFDDSIRKEKIKGYDVLNVCKNIDKNIAAAIWEYYCHMWGHSKIENAKKQFIEEIKTY